MVTFNRHQPRVGAALVLAFGLCVAATPGFAQRSERGEVDGARARALQECNQAAAKYSPSTWGDYQFHVYRSCMTNHGQQP